MEAQQTQLVQQGIKKEGFHITVTQMCITAVFMALTCVATMVVQIPIPLGYAHLGDSVILICAFFFGPVVGALAGGIGSAMADILTGFAVWAVPTLIIKTIMPIIACAIFGNMKSKFDRCKVISVKGIVGAVVTLLFMTLGWLYIFLWQQECLRFLAEKHMIPISSRKSKAFIGQKSEKTASS